MEGSNEAHVIVQRARRFGIFTRKLAGNVLLFKNIMSIN